MLSETIKAKILENLDEAVGDYYRSKDQFHSELKKIEQKRQVAASAVADAKKTSSSATAKEIKQLQSRVDGLYGDSDALVAAADRHHGNGTGDVLRDHAHMALEPRDGKVDTYNLPANVAVRKSHGITTDKNLAAKPETPPVAAPTTATVQTPPKAPKDDSEKDNKSLLKYLLNLHKKQQAKPAATAPTAVTPQNNTNSTPKPVGNSKPKAEPTPKAAPASKAKPNHYIPLKDPSHPDNTLGHQLLKGSIFQKNADLPDKIKKFVKFEN